MWLNEKINFRVCSYIQAKPWVPLMEQDLCTILEIPTLLRFVVEFELLIFLFFFVCYVFLLVFFVFWFVFKFALVLSVYVRHLRLKVSLVYVAFLLNMTYFQTVFCHLICGANATCSNNHSNMIDLLNNTDINSNITNL